MTDAPVGFAEKPPTVAATRHKAKKGCVCDKDCKRLRGDHDLLRSRLENHLKAHELAEEVQRPEVWTYKCTTVGCGQLIETGPPIPGRAPMRCPMHGMVPLDLVSPRPS